MADDFKDVVDEIKKTNKAVDKLAKATDPKGASAAEDKRDEANAAARSEGYLKTIAGAVGGGGPGKSGPEDEKSGGMLTGIAGALGRMGKGIGKGIGGFVKGIGSAASGAGQFAFVMGAVGAGIAAFVAALGAGAWAVAKMMPTIADGLKSFDGINGNNLGQVGKGMGHLGVGLASMGAGGAIAGVGNLVGSIADGIGGLFGAKSGQEQLMEKLKKFSEVKLNVKNIKDNSEAMVAYGIAMTAGGAGTAMEAVGKFAAGTLGKIGEMFGAVPVLDALKDFAAVKIDKAMVKNNAEAMAEYTKAMALGAAAKGMEALSSLGGFVTSAADGLSKLMGGDSTIDSLLIGMQKMSSASGIDKKKIQDVSDALVSYTGAMALGAGAHTATALGSIGNLVTSAADGLSKLIGGKSTLGSMLSGMKEMSSASGIDKQKIEDVANALISYTAAMAEGAKGTWFGALGSVGNLVTGAVDGLTKLMGGEGQLDSMLTNLKKVSAAEGIDGTKITMVAKALIDYTAAMAEGSKGSWFGAIGSVGSLVTGAVDGLTSFITGGKKKSSLDTMLESLKKISAATGIDGPKITMVAKALVDYAKAMAGGAAGEAGKAVGSVATFVTGAVDGLSSMLLGGEKKSSIDSMLEGLKKMSAAKDIDGAVVERNATAMVQYAKAMAAGAGGEGGKAVGAIAGFAGGVVSGLSSFFGIEKADPLGDLKKFAATIISEKEVAQIKLNATGITAYAEAMVKMGTIQVGKSFGDALSNLFSGIGSLFGGGEKSPITALQNFASANIDSEKIKKDISTLLSVLQDPNVDLKKSWIFRKILKNIAAGLEKFVAPGGFTGLLAAAGQSLLNFLTGDKSPIEQVEIIAGKSIELREGAAAIETISDGLEKMAALKFDGSNINISDFAADLLQSVPLIEAAIMGGKVEKGLLEKMKFWSGDDDKEFKGLASGEISWGKAATNIEMMRKALGGAAATEMGGSGGGRSARFSKVNRMQVNTIVAQRLINRAIEKGATGQGGNNVVTDASIKQSTDARSYNQTITSTEMSNSNRVVAALAFPS